MIKLLNNYYTLFDMKEDYKKTLDYFPEKKEELLKKYEKELRKIVKALTGDENYALSNVFVIKDNDYNNEIDYSKLKSIFSAYSLFVDLGQDLYEAKNILGDKILFKEIQVYNEEIDKIELLTIKYVTREFLDKYEKRGN